MPLTVSRCDYLRQVLGEMAKETSWEIAWLNHYGIDLCELCRKKEVS